MKNIKFVEIKNPLGVKDYLEFRESHEILKKKTIVINGTLYTTDIADTRLDLVEGIKKEEIDTPHLRETGKVVIDTQFGINVKVSFNLYKAVKNIISKQDYVAYDMITKKEYKNIEDVTTITKIKTPNKIILTAKDFINDLIKIVDECKRLKKSELEKDNITSVSVKAKFKEKNIQKFYDVVKKSYKIL